MPMTMKLTHDPRRRSRTAGCAPARDPSAVPRSSETRDPNAAEHRSALTEVGRRALVLVVSGALLFVAMLGIGLLLTRTAFGAAVDGPDVAVLQWVADRRVPALDA